jgi:aspartate racemase
MKERIIGILGGMGPEATLDCYAKIIKNTPASKDQDHLQVIINSDPKVPDRTAAILGRGESPLPALIAGVQALDKAGAEFIIIPCVSAHMFLEVLIPQVSLPILSIFDAVAETIAREHPAIKKVGLLGTTGTVKGGLFQKRLESDGLQILVPDDASQTRVMEAIYTIKDVQATQTREEIAAALSSVARELIDRGAQGIIAGCTEIPLALQQAHLSVPYFDALTVLGREAIRRAGLEPSPLP